MPLCTLGSEVPFNPGSALSHLPSLPLLLSLGLRAPSRVLGSVEGLQGSEPRAGPRAGQSCLGGTVPGQHDAGPAGQRGAQMPDTVNLISHPQQHRGQVTTCQESSVFMPPAQHFMFNPVLWRTALLPNDLSFIKLEWVCDKIPEEILFL